MMNLWQKLIEIRKLVKCLQKDTVGKVGFKDYPYISTDLILDKIMDKMNELGVLLEPRISNGIEREFHYQNSKGDNKVDFVVTGQMGYTWINADEPTERESIDWYYYGQQDEVSKALGSGLTYSNRYFLKMFFQIATSDDDPDQRDTSGKNTKGYQTTNSTQGNETHNLSDAQVKRAFAIAIKKGYNAESVKKGAMKKYNVTAIEKLTKTQYDELCAGYEGLPDKS